MIIGDCRHDARNNYHHYQWPPDTTGRAVTSPPRSGLHALIRPIVRVMLVDDHTAVRAGYRRLLEEQAHIKVVAEAADAEQAYQLFVEHEPEVVVLDVSMPGASGLETIRRILGTAPRARILVFSMHEDAMLVERAIQLGARGYISKRIAPELLATAIDEVAAGRLHLSSDIANSIAIVKLNGDNNPVQVLSAREFEIFRLIIAGSPTEQIAKALRLSIKTVANYHTLIKHKLGAPSDVDLVLLARRHNMLEPRSWPFAEAGTQ
jgi:two-component system, NarL family, invasion response regulator UvrY